MSEHRLEDALRDSLRREEPPAGFAAKILAQTVGGPTLHVVPRAARSWLQRPVGLAMAAAIAALAIVPAVVVEQHRREQERGLKAKQELLTALAITREQLQQAKARVERTTGEQR
ncbi:MAG TPA: hypothetical protein VHC72_03980 [Bryobacteraceae bacterium]|nr:hypothetical protein [Bryobacteraceae bacterium]